jgi:hypothetical protein
MVHHVSKDGRMHCGQILRVRLGATLPSQMIRVHGAAEMRAPLVNACKIGVRRSAIAPGVASNPRDANRYASAVQQTRWFLPAIEDLRLHEHRNFFDKRSLTILLEQIGFRLSALQSDTSSYRPLTGKV